MTQGLIKLLKEIDIVNRKNVSLRAGQPSNYYFDVKKSYGRPDVLTSMGKAMIRTMDEGITCVAAKGYGGIPLATAISILGRIPLSIVRDGAQKHGLGKHIEGYIPTERDMVAIVDDVLTSGGSIREVEEIVLAAGARIQGAYIVVRRNDIKMNFPVKYLIDGKDLL
ncbi:MAG: hypothetical protein AABW71_00830 [Nanoarchaeota archaeon]